MPGTATAPDPDYTRLLFGQHAVRVPAWLYIQRQGEATVSFVGCSRLDTAGAQPHPLRLGSRRTHQLLVGEIIVRPYAALGTDALRGHGLGGLVTEGHDIETCLRHGEIILDPSGRFAAANR